MEFKIDFNYVEGILRTLPISYYTGRDISVELSDDGGTSTYSPLNDSIVVSYNNVAMIFDRIKEIGYIENLVRAELYHEISHALLTPMDLLRSEDYIGGDQRLNHDVVNIFEDERIETILRDTFYGVEFKKSIILLNDWDPSKPPKDALEAFYQIVRFRHDYKPDRVEFIKRTIDIINTYSKLTRERVNWGMLQKYVVDIGDLFWDIAKDWMEENKKDEILQKDPGYDGKSDGGQMGTIKSMINQEVRNNDGGDGTESGLGGTIIITPAKGVKSKGDPQVIECDDDGGEKEKIAEALADAIRGLEEQLEGKKSKRTDLQEMLKTELNKFVDDNLTQRISDIIENFLSRNKNNSAAIMRYSGMLNPRLVGREDWRIWTYKSQHGPIKGYDKMHLNLFIDTSGSYYNNEDKTNTILKSLDSLEHKYPFFSFDLVTCQVGEVIRNKGERYIQTDGGNFLDEKAAEIFNKLQYHDSFNYNIVLFDGYAFTDCRRRGEEYHKNFSAFNSSKCSIISDNDNKKAIEKYAPQAHSIFVERNFGRGMNKSYADMLFDNILEAFRKALL